MTDRVLIYLFVLVLYLLDSVILLYSNEVLIRVSSPTRFKVVFPKRTYTVLDRSILIPALKGPMTPVFRAILDEKIPNNTEGKDIHHWILNYRIYRNLAFPTSILISILVVAAPMALFAPVTIWYGVAIAVIYYLTNITALIYVFIKRDKLGLKLSHLIGIAVETIACPPCAVNLIHKITLGQSRNNKIISFLKNKTSTPHFHKILTGIADYLSDLDTYQIHNQSENDCFTNFRKVISSIVPKYLDISK